MEPKLVTRRRDLTVLNALRRREPVFHRPEFAAPAELARMVAPEFWEIGASGRRYSRAYVLKTLAVRAVAPLADDWETSDFHLRVLAPGLYLLTYTLAQGERLTRRTSLWQRSGRSWRILFHQGTVVED